METKKYSITGLSLAQYCIICNLVDIAKDIMQYDESLERYTDNGNFLYSLYEEDYQELMKMKL